MAGFFTMEDANVIETMSLPKAKTYCTTKINEKEGAKPENKFKAYQAIAKANTITQLQFTVANFVIAHDHPQDKVIR